MRVSKLHVPRGTATCPSAGELLEWKTKDFQANISQNWHFDIFEVDLLSERLDSVEQVELALVQLGSWLLLIWF